MAPLDAVIDHSRANHKQIGPLTPKRSGATSHSLAGEGYLRFDNSLSEQVP